MGTPSTAPGLYGIVRGSRNAARATAAKNREHNDNFVFMGDANLTHIPQFWVGLFNVSDLEQRIERPWVHPRVLSAVAAEKIITAKYVVIPAAEDGQPYGRPFVIPDIVQMPEERPGDWRFRTFGQDGRFLAQDVINPEDPTGNWTTVRKSNEAFATNIGTNLYRFGCFWMTAKKVEELIPTEEMLETAHARLEETYNDLVEEAKNLAMQGAEGIKQIGSLHRRAANYFGLTDLEWNKRYVRRIPCPNCDEPLSPSAAVCTKCPAVINWQKAVALGLRTPAQAAAAGIIPDQAKDMATPASSPTRKREKKK